MDELNLEILHRECNKGYGHSTIPSNRDYEILGMIRGAITANMLEELRAKISLDHCAVLRVFSERIASLSVRLKDYDLLNVGLLALGLSFLDDSNHESILILPLYYRAAGILSKQPEQLFFSVAQQIGEPASTELRRFLGRSGRDKSIDAMGYIEVMDENGFSFQRRW